MQTAQQAILNQPAQHFEYLGLDQVMQITSLSSATIYRMVARKEFPEPVALTERTKRWVDYEVYGWNQERLQEARNSSK